MSQDLKNHYDVVILGAGQAGLSLARQLLLAADKKILMVDWKAEIPPARQKVGEATVQVSGYYFSKVLDLEEHLLRDHYMKYNLRFMWKSAGRSNGSYEDYSQSYIRPLSNIASYQLNRNKLEAELLARNRQSPHFQFLAPLSDLDVTLAADGPHTLRLESEGREASFTAEWVVDATGRGRFLAKRMGLTRRNPIRHGSFFAWVDGLVNIEKLTDRSPAEIRLAPERAAIGHLPVWLATNHFAGEGFWLWVIPLQGRTSLGVVFDRETFSHKKVSSPEKLIAWICEEFPLFARDLPQREVVDFMGLPDFSYDCAETISAAKWALSGEAGRFSDPLYSPGGDLIALHNTLITAAILADEDRSERETRVRAYEQLLRAVYEAYVPSYAESYDVLGDQEAYSLKYTWELTVYFGLYVFPFINDLFTDRRFIFSFLRTFSRLGPVNKNLQRFLSAYYQWKKAQCQPPAEPVFYDFTEIGALRKAETTFYKVGISLDEARKVLAAQYANLEELARFIGAHVASVVLGDERVLTHRRFVESIDLDELRFDPAEMRQRYASFADADGIYEWTFDPFVLARLRTAPRRHTGDHEADVKKEMVSS